MKIKSSPCVTCTSGIHKDVQSPRPFCVQIEFDSDQWLQICRPCWEKLKKMIDKEFDKDNYDILNILQDNYLKEIKK